MNVKIYKTHCSFNARRAMHEINYKHTRADVRRTHFKRMCICGRLRDASPEHIRNNIINSMLLTNNFHVGQFDYYLLNYSIGFANTQLATAQLYLNCGVYRFVFQTQTL